MHTQLVNLGTLKHFRYQTYLMDLFFHNNQDHFVELQIYEPLALEEEISFVDKDKSEGMFKFIN